MVSTAAVDGTPGERTCLKYLRENWYMGSISERLAMTK